MNPLLVSVMYSFTCHLLLSTVPQSCLRTTTKRLCHHPNDHDLYLRVVLVKRSSTLHSFSTKKYTAILPNHVTNLLLSPCISAAAITILCVNVQQMWSSPFLFYQAFLRFDAWERYHETIMISDIVLVLHYVSRVHTILKIMASFLLSKLLYILAK